MKFDRNTVIGFLILGALLVGYFIMTSKEQQRYQKYRAQQDSIARARLPRPDTSVRKPDTSTNSGKGNLTAPAANYSNAAGGAEKIVEVENDLFKIAFTSKGGQPKWVELKNFKNQDSGFVRLASTSFDKIDYRIATSDNSSTDITNLNFIAGEIIKSDDGTQTINFNLVSDSGETSVTHQFIVKKADYMIDFNLQMNGADKLLSQGILNLNWQYKALQQEMDLAFEKQNTQIGYVMDDEFDYHTIGRRSDKQFSDPVKWVGVRQRFFNTILVAKNNFSSGKIEWIIPDDKEKTVVQSTASLRLDVPPGSAASIPLSIYYGPADYRLLKKYDMQMGKLVNLGQGIYAFVRPLNKYVVMPVFDFIKSMGVSYGIAIVILTFIIRLLISPLTYSSYLSGAKMKVLRPEITKLKEKFGNDQQAMSMEQMKLFREAGVNPLGGCIPALLQIPIFFALYSFFNSTVDLRGVNFLWAKDLSAHDSILDLGFNIPLYGDHVSLFTITATVTSFLISLYSMSLTPDQSNPVLKYMPYIFPIFLLFIFNNLPSGLTWYYTVSNIITLGLQFVIQNYIIDHDKILAKIEENRKKPKPKSKWQQRLEQMQETQKKVREMQEKAKKK